MDKALSLNMGTLSCLWSQECFFPTGSQVVREENFIVQTWRVQILDLAKKKRMIFNIL